MRSKKYYKAFPPSLELIDEVELICIQNLNRRQVENISNDAEICWMHPFHTIKNDAHLPHWFDRHHEDCNNVGISYFDYEELSLMYMRLRN